MSNIKNYSKDKGFEIIPRGLLQHENLSLQAIGLLCNLQSYPEDWNLHKTELYTRFKKNKKTSVSNAWDELVNENYIVQLRRRDGKKWNYIYYFNLEPFTEDQVKEIEDAEQAKSMSFKTGNTEKNENDLGCGFSEAQNGKPKMGSPKPADKRIHIKENTHKENTHKENTHLLEKEEEEEKKINNNNFEHLTKYLKGQQIDEATIDETINELLNRNIFSCSFGFVDKQFTHMMSKLDTGEVDLHKGFAKYFARGIEIMSAQKNAHKLHKQEMEQTSEMQQAPRQGQPRDTSFYYNWLEDK